MFLTARPKCRRHQFGVHVFGQMFQLRIVEPAHPTISIVIRFPGFCCDFATTFDHHVIALGNQAIRDILILIANWAASGPSNSVITACLL